MDKKISQLTAATTPLTGAEELAIVQSGVTKKTTIEDVKGYKVYTALLTQSGSDNPLLLPDDLGQTASGQTYTIISVGAGEDWTLWGAPNNNPGTSFVATGAANVVTSELSTNSGAPVVTVLENTIGNIWWTYSGLGEYFINSNGLFSINKTIGFITFNNCCAYGLGDKPFLAISPLSVNSVLISSAVDGVGADGVISNTPIEIRVYN